MARILIFEPHGDIRALLEIVVSRIGHEPVVCDCLHAEAECLDVASNVQAAVIEPGEGDGIPLARRLRERGVPVVFTSIFPAGPEALDLEPTAYLIKPFALYALEQALEDAFRTESAAV